MDTSFLSSETPPYKAQLTFERDQIAAEARVDAAKTRGTIRFRVSSIWRVVFAVPWRLARKYASNFAAVCRFTRGKELWNTLSRWFYAARGRYSAAGVAFSTWR